MRLLLSKKEKGVAFVSLSVIAASALFGLVYFLFSFLSSQDSEVEGKTIANKEPSVVGSPDSDSYEVSESGNNGDSSRAVRLRSNKKTILIEKPTEVFNTSKKSGEVGNIQHPSQRPSHSNHIPQKSQEMLKTCEDYRNELLRCLEEEQDEDNLKALFDKTKELCSLDMLLADFVREHFEKKDKELLESSQPTLNHLRKLENVQKNLKHIVPTHKLKDVAGSSCQIHGKIFMDAYNKLEQDPTHHNAPSLAKEAQSLFPIAKVFCESQPKGSPYYHESFKQPVFANFLINNIKSLLAKSSLDAMKYIQMLRYLRPNVPLAFQGCDTLEEVLKKNKESQNIFPKVITDPKEFLIKTGINVQEALQLDESEIQKVLTTSVEYPSDSRERCALEYNLSSLKLVQMCLQKYDGNQLVQNWGKAGFALHNNQEVEELLKANIADHNTLKELFGSIKEHHEMSYYYKKSIGDVDGERQADLDYIISQFILSAVGIMKDQLPIILAFCKVNTLEDAEWIINQATGKNQLDDLLYYSVSLTLGFQKYDSPLYSYIGAELHSRKTLIDLNNCISALPENERNDFAFPPKSAQILVRAFESPDFAHRDWLRKLYHHCRDLEVREKALNAYFQSLDPPPRPPQTEVSDLLLKTVRTQLARHLVKRKSKDSKIFLDYESHGFDLNYIYQDIVKAAAMFKDIRKHMNGLECSRGFVNEFEKKEHGCTIANRIIKCFDPQIEHHLKLNMNNPKWKGYSALKTFMDDALSQPNMESVRQISCRAFYDRSKFVQESLNQFILSSYNMEIFHIESSSFML